MPLRSAPFCSPFAETPPSKLLRSLVPEGKLDADGVTYDSLVRLLNTHYSKKQSTIVHRFNFNTRSRQPSESIADYIAALRELALNCKFGDQDRLEEMLRDRLVCGVNHSGIQRKLLSEGELTYASALKLAQTIEAAEKDAKKLGDSNKQFASPVPSGIINHTKTTSPSSLPTGSGFTPTCYRCGGPHLAPRCRHKDTECRYCKKKGHLARVCKAKTRASSRSLDPVSTPANQDKTIPSKKSNYVGKQSNQYLTLSTI